MMNERPLTVTRRVFVQRAAIIVGSLIATACGASNPPQKTPTAKPSVVPPDVSLPTPGPVPSPSPTQATEQTIYVNPSDASASDTNPGTESRPLKTIAQAAGITADNIAHGIATIVMISP